MTEPKFCHDCAFGERIPGPLGAELFAFEILEFAEKWYEEETVYFHLECVGAWLADNPESAVKLA